jgi:hypothetical protein
MTMATTKLIIIIIIIIIMQYKDHCYKTIIWEISGSHSGQN